MERSDDEVEECFTAIESYIEKANKTTNTVLKDFADILKDEKDFHTRDQELWQPIKTIHNGRRSERFEAICKQTQEENNKLKKRIEQIDNEIDNLSIQAIVEKENTHSKYNKELKRLHLINLDEETKLKNQLEELKNRCTAEEQQVRSRIDQELTKKRSDLYKMKSNFKSQIIDKNNLLQQAQRECQDLRRQRDELRRQFNQMDLIPMHVEEKSTAESYVTSSDYEVFERSFQKNRGSEFMAVEEKRLDKSFQKKRGTDFVAVKEERVIAEEQRQVKNVQTQRNPPKVFEGKHRKRNM